jgi:hypothetical protein
MAVADFDRLEVLHPFQVEVVRADHFHVDVTADDNVIDHVKGVKEGSTLTIMLDEDKTYHLKAGSLGLKISMPALSSIGLSHGARGTIAGFKSDRPFSAKVSHGSVLDGSVEAGDTVLDASHGSTLRLKGKAKDGQLKVSRGSNLFVGDLALHAVDLDVQHGSTARINTKSAQPFKAKAMHGSTLVGSVEAASIGVDADHGSRANLEGKAGHAVLKSHHGGSLALGKLALDRAEIELGHASSATIHAKDALDYRMNNGSSLKYVGKPKLGRSESSHGSSARSISAEDAARDKVDAPKEPGVLTRPPQGDMIITIGTNRSMIHIGNHGAGAMIGSGKVATKTADVSGFHAIEANLPALVEVTRGNRFKVTLSADDNLIDHIQAVKDGEALKLSLERGSYHTVARMKVNITMPAIDTLTLDGAAQATVQGFESDKPFVAHLDGASRLDGSIKAGKLTIESDGAGATTLQGAAKSLTLKVNGASHINLSKLPVDTADITLDGASHARVDTQKELSYTVSGASHLEYAGQPTIQRKAKHDVSHVSHK